MNDNVPEALLLMVVGMSAVVAALVLLAGMIWLFRKLDERLNARRISTYARKVEHHVIDTDINDEVVAVLAAAAASVLQQQVVVRRVHFLDSRGPGAWATTGRVNIMASHLIQKGTQ